MELSRDRISFWIRKINIDNARRVILEMTLTLVIVCAFTWAFVPAVSATPGAFYADGDSIQTSTWGNQAVISVTSLTVISGSAVAVCADMEHVSAVGQEWVQAGWVKGVTLWSPSNTGLYSYLEYDIYVSWESPVHWTYHGEFCGAITVGSTHTYVVNYNRYVGYRYDITIDTVLKKEIMIGWMAGMPATFAESHDSSNVMAGHCYQMKYMMPYGRSSVMWYNWNGYSAYWADSPYWITQPPQNTQFWFGRN